jgi:aldehyde dehydrogenase (NAD+)
VSDKIQVASEGDVDKAVAAAKAALPLWSARPGGERAAIMLKFAELLEKNAAKIAKLESVAMGQPIGVATKFTALPASYWRYFAGFADKITGESSPPDGDGLFKIVSYEPLGVCAGISAWNATTLLFSWKESKFVFEQLNTILIAYEDRSSSRRRQYHGLQVF